MGAKRNIYVGDSLSRLLERRSEGFSITIAVNAAASRYLAICRASLPEFDPNEWCAVIDSLESIALSLLATEDRERAYELAVRAIPRQFADAERLQNLSAKWQVDGPGIAEQIGRLTFAELAAIAEVAECYWSGFEGTADDAVRRAVEAW